MSIIKVARIDAPIHRTGAAYVAHILNNYKYEVEIKTSSKEEAFRSLVENESDLLVSSWIPGFHLHNMTTALPYHDNVLALGTLFHPYFSWFVPGYVAEGLATSVEDLTDPDTAALFFREIYVINCDDYSALFFQDTIAKHRLDDAGFKFKHVSEDVFTEALAGHTKEARPCLVAFWSPCSLKFKYNLRELEGITHPAVPSGKAVLLMHKNAITKLNISARNALQHVYLSNDKASMLEQLVFEEHYHIEIALKIIEQDTP